MRRSYTEAGTTPPPPPPQISMSVHNVLWIWGGWGACRNVKGVIDRLT